MQCLAGERRRSFEAQDVLFDADPIFIIMENFFCIFFLAELTIRHGAVKNRTTQEVSLGQVWDLQEDVLYLQGLLVPGRPLLSGSHASWRQ